MHDRVFRIHLDADDPRHLTRSVLQVTDLLGFLQAELARVLQLTCVDIGQLAAGRCILAPGSVAWSRGRLYVRLYRALYDLHHGDGVAMYHSLRIPHAALGGVPHLLIVDDGRLAEVVDYLEQIPLPPGTA